MSHPHKMLRLSCENGAVLNIAEKVKSHAQFSLLITPAFQKKGGMDLERTHLHCTALRVCNAYQAKAPHERDTHAPSSEKREIGNLRSSKRGMSGDQTVLFAPSVFVRHERAP